MAGTMCVRRAGGQRLVDGRRRIQARRFVLREVLHDDVVAFDALAARRAPPRRRACASASTCRRRSGPTSAMRSPRSMCRLRSSNTTSVAVGLARVLQLEHRPAALGARGEVEVDLLALGRHLDRHDLLEHLDPALHLRRLGRLVAEPVDEHPDARDLLVLLALGLAQLLDARLVRDEVVRCSCRRSRSACAASDRRCA